jgi:DNA-binding transcriptional ArsR family regulator
VGALPDEVKQFIEGNIDSVEQLEILRVLGEDRSREWAASDLARVSQARPEAVGAHLSALQGRGLLVVVARGTDLFCRHGPATPELEAMVSRLLQVYRERPVTMINLIYDRAKDSLRSFADAFRLRKEG